jgi:hypothetical protein
MDRGTLLYKSKTRKKLNVLSMTPIRKLKKGNKSVCFRSGMNRRSLPWRGYPGQRISMRGNARNVETLLRGLLKQTCERCSGQTHTFVGRGLYEKGWLIASLNQYKRFTEQDIFLYMYMLTKFPFVTQIIIQLSFILPLNEYKVLIE